MRKESIIICIFLLLNIKINAQQTNIQYIYDDLNRLIQIIYTNGCIKKYTYDRVGNRTEHKIQCNATPPDLKLGQGNVSSNNTFAGGTVNINFLIQNIGQQAAGANKTYFYINTVPNLTNAVKIDSVLHVSIPQGGINVTKNVNVPINTTPGAKYIIIQLDGQNIVVESNEDNNLGYFTINVNSCSGVNANITSNIPASCNQANGSATVVGTGATSYTYAWNNNPQTLVSSASSLFPGEYQVTVTANNGCVVTKNVTITNNGVVPSADFTYNADPSITKLFSNISTNAPSSFSWDFGDGYTSSIGSPSHTFSQDGFYDVCLTATNTCGSDVECKNIEVNNGCSIPNNLNAVVINDSTVLVNWLVSSGVGSFLLQYKAVDSETWIETIVQNSFDTLTLISGLNYHFRVRSNCNIIFSSWSYIYNFFIPNSNYLVISKLFKTYNYGTAPFLVGNINVESKKIAYNSLDKSYFLLGRIFSTDTAIIIKTDSLFNTLWVKYYKMNLSGQEDIIDLKLDNYGYIYVSSFENDGGYTKTILLKLSMNGDTVIWSKSYDNLFDKSPVMALDSSSNIYLSGYFNLPSQRNLYGIVKLNANGVILWSRQFEKTGSSGIQSIQNIRLDNNSNIFVVGSIAISSNVQYFIAKHNNHGNLLWSKSYFETEQSNSIVDIQFGSNNTLYFLANNISDNTSPYIIYGKIDQSGNSIFNRSKNFTQGIKLKIHNSNLYLLCRRYNYAPTYQNGMIMRIDTSLDVEEVYDFKQLTNEPRYGLFSDFAIIDTSINIVGHFQNPYSSSNTFSLGIVRTKINDLDWGCRSQFDGFGTSGGGTFQLTNHTIVSDTFTALTINANLIQTGSKIFSDTISCISQCNITSSFLIDKDTLCKNTPIQLTYTGINGTNFIWRNKYKNNEILSYERNPKITFTNVDSVLLELVVYNNFCNERWSKKIYFHDSPSVIFDSIINPTCNFSTNGRLSSIGMGNNPPFSYFWNTNSTNRNINGLTTGSYIVKVVDSKGCNVTDTFELNSSVSPPQAEFLPYQLPLEAVTPINIPYELVSIVESPNSTNCRVRINNGLWVQLPSCNNAPGYQYSLLNPGWYPATLKASNACGEITINKMVEIKDCAWYADIDGDGYGNPSAGFKHCDTIPYGYVQNKLDCNDNNATIFNLAPELCDGLDNNCNGLIDEGFSGTTEYCNGIDDNCDGLIDNNVSLIVASKYDYNITSLRSLIECAEQGDTIIIGSNIDTLFLNSTLFIDKEITIIGNNDVVLVDLSRLGFANELGGYVVGPNGKVTFDNVGIISTNNSLQTPIIRNLGVLELSNCRIEGFPSSIILNDGLEFIINGVVQIK